MHAIECVVFDIGNVLLRWDPHNLYRRMGYSDVEIASILAETGLPKINGEILDAGGPFSSTIAALAGRFPQHAQFIQAFDERWVETLDGAIEANAQLIEGIKQAGLPVYAISNFNREKFDIARKLMPFLDTFDELVLSGDVGLLKPEAPIFNLLMTRRNVSPSRAVFIDDSSANIATAKALGFVTVHFKDRETNLRTELLKLRVPLASMDVRT